jgi:hypothetical protein
MNCDKFRQWLPMVADCLLTPEQQTLLETHLTQCPACRKEAETYQQIAECCCHLKEVEIPCDFYGRLANRLRAECREPEAKPWFWQTPLLVSSFGAAALLLAALLTYPTHSPLRPEAPKSLLADIPTHSPVVKLAPLLNPRPHTVAAVKERPPVMTEAKGSELPEKNSANPEKAKAETVAAAPVTEAPPQANPSRSTLLQDAVFAQGGQFVPAYTMPQAGSNAAANTEEAPVMARLNSVIPQRPETSVARTSEELQALLTKAQQTKPLFTELDWKKQMLAAVFLSAADAPGYHLKLYDIVQMPDKIVIQYRVLRPVSVLPAAETVPPALFVVLPFSPLPVEFQEQ